MKKVNYVDAILTACSNPKFVEFVIENQDKENTDSLEFSIYEEVYDIRKKEGEWIYGCLLDKKACWDRITNRKTLIIKI